MQVENVLERKHIIELLQQHQHNLKHYGVCTIALFGSAARDQLGPTSDVDVLVEFEGPTTFDQYMDTKFYLEDLFGRSVDLVTRRTLKAQVLPFVERELVYVA